MCAHSLTRVLSARPNVDGLTSTKMIRAIGYQAPIVALTAFAEESNIKDCYDSGMNYFLWVLLYFQLEREAVR